MNRNRGYSALLLTVILISVSAHAAVNAKSETFKTSDGVTLHYFDAGSGPAIVFIPGWTMAADIFEPQINGLSQRFRIVALDPRSQGDSEKVPDGNYLERHAQDVKELIDHLQLQGVVLLGWSNGVPDTLTFVDRYGTANLRGVVLVDGFIDIAPEMQKGMDTMLLVLQADRAKFTDNFVRSMYNTKQMDEYIQHVKDQSLKTPTNTAVTEIFNVVARADFTPILAKLDKPVIYICEKRLSPQGDLLKAKIPSARVEVFPNAGHAIFVDEPEHFNKVLADFVDSLGAPAKP
ncbi:MAG TPA: alpha/beta hydrolase [Terriglobales bacterium]